MPSEGISQPAVSTRETWYERKEHERDDQRSPCARDRDRILYCSAFRRLAGVTQVVAPTEGHVFHNRLTHSLEVAQIARRIAEKILQKQSELAMSVHDGIDEDAVEAGALAHDLGHPPFGHVAELELDRIVRDEGQEPDGYEGNAQSFRIVSKLAVRSKEYRGLNLTRVTLNAILKYPWFRETTGKCARKWGAYRREKPEFEFARKELYGEFKDLSIESAIMTWADDIAYSIHDTEDFYRAGLVPLDRLAANVDERTKFLECVKARWNAEGNSDALKDWGELESAFLGLCEWIPVCEPYVGTGDQRFYLRTLTSELIGKYINSTKLSEDRTNPFKINPLVRREVKMLKELTWHYVINNPSLAAQQHGQTRIIRELMRTYMDAANRASPSWKIFPPRFRQEMDELQKTYRQDIPHDLRVRTAADTVASMTDLEALNMFQRLTGILPGSVLDPITL